MVQTRTHWVLPSEAARLAGVSASYIRMLVDSKRLRARRSSLGIRLIDRAALKDWLVRKRRTGWNSATLVPREHGITQVTKSATK